MKIHENVLGKRQRRVLNQLGPHVTAKGFYLAGGTALALRLGHRRSVDLDWFSSEPVGDPLLLAGFLREQGIPFVAEQIAPGTLHGRVRGVRVSLLEYRYPLLKRTNRWNVPGCGLASLDDLAAMKLSALSQRGAKKDFVDLYFLGKRHAPFARLLKMYQARFQVKDIAHLLYSLAYFQDADRERLPVLLYKQSWPAIKREIQKWVEEMWD